MIFWRSILSVQILCFCIISCRDFERFRIIRLGQFNDLHEFYQNVRRQNGKSYDEPGRTTDKNAKKRICSNIFESASFENVGIVPVNVDSMKTYLELKFKYPEIRDDLFAKPPPNLRPFFGRHHHYVNPTTRIDVGVDEENVPEFVFVCIGRCVKTKEIKKLYVSEEYNLNLEANAAEDYIAGRFVFVYEIDIFKFVVMAVVEKTATVTATFEHNIEKIYLEARGDKNIAERVENDPICKLDLEMQIEICASVLNSSHFKNVVKYSPTARSITEDCHKYKVAIQSDTTSNYEEWMMYCVADSAKKLSLYAKYRNYHHTKFLFYVSRAYASHNVFVYTFFEGMMRLENLSTNVIHVRDP